MGVGLWRSSALMKRVESQGTEILNGGGIDLAKELSNKLVEKARVKAQIKSRLPSLSTAVVGQLGLAILWALRAGKRYRVTPANERAPRSPGAVDHSLWNASSRSVSCAMFRKITGIIVSGPIRSLTCAQSECRVQTSIDNVQPS
jgi:hypothetical protein